MEEETCSFVLPGVTNVGGFWCVSVRAQLCTRACVFCGDSFPFAHCVAPFVLLQEAGASVCRQEWFQNLKKCSPFATQPRIHNCQR